MYPNESNSRILRYEYDQVNQENDRLQGKLFQIKQLIYKAQRENKTTESYSITLQYILKMIEV